MTKGSGDEGADIVLQKNNQKAIVQCKKHSKPIGPSIARELLGTVVSHKSHLGFLVCTGGFTSGVYKFVQKNPIIKLMETESLIEMQLSLGGKLGYKKKLKVDLEEIEADEDEEQNGVDEDNVSGELKSALLNYRESNIDKKDCNKSDGILRDEMIDNFVLAKPTNKEEFRSKMPLRLRENIDKNQLQFFEGIFEIISSHLKKNI